MSKSLEGKFVIYSGPESYRTGQIKEVFDDAVMVQFDRMAGDNDTSWSLPMELVCLEEMTHAVDEGFKVWGFFETREALDKYLAWLDGPDDKDIKLAPKTKH